MSEGEAELSIPQHATALLAPQSDEGERCLKCSEQTPGARYRFCVAIRQTLSPHIVHEEKVFICDRCAESALVPVPKRMRCAKLRATPEPTMSVMSASTGTQSKRTTRGEKRTHAPFSGGVTCQAAVIDRHMFKDGTAILSGVAGQRAGADGQDALVVDAAATDIRGVAGQCAAIVDRQGPEIHDSASEAET